MLEGIRDISQSHTNVNRREGCYKISDRIKQRQSECEIEFKDLQNMGKGFHKVFKTILKEISQDLLLGESSSEVSHLITEPRNFLKLQNYQMK